MSDISQEEKESVTNFWLDTHIISFNSYISKILEESNEA